MPGDVRNIAAAICPGDKRHEMRAIESLNYVHVFSI